jgi:hypothetical protein
MVTLMTPCIVVEVLGVEGEKLFQEHRINSKLGDALLIVMIGSTFT